MGTKDTASTGVDRRCEVLKQLEKLNTSSTYFEKLINFAFVEVQISLKKVQTMVHLLSDI